MVTLSRRRLKRSPPGGIVDACIQVRGPDRVAISGRRFRGTAKSRQRPHPGQKIAGGSAGQGRSYVVSALAPDSAGPTDSRRFISFQRGAGCRSRGRWDGLGLRANASAPMTLEDCEVVPDVSTDRRRRGLSGHAASRNAAVQILGRRPSRSGICRAARRGRRRISTPLDLSIWVRDSGNGFCYARATCDENAN